MDYGRQNGRAGQAYKVAEDVAHHLRGLEKFSKLNADELDKFSNKMGEQLKNGGLKTSQIRKFLAAVRSIQNKVKKGEHFDREEIVLLKPKLAYAAGRQPREVKPLMTVLNPAIDKVRDKLDFDKFVRFVEGIVAYHKYYGGGD